MRKFCLAMAAVGGGCFAQAQAATIAFDPLAGLANGTDYSAHAEAGFDIEGTDGDWRVVNGFGAPAPAIIANSPAEITVTAGLADFTFKSVDFGNASSVTEFTYEIEGFADGVMAFMQSGTIDAVIGFTTINSINASALIDTLVIRVVDSVLLGYLIDNIVVEPVPVPGAALLMLTGLGGVAAIRRRRRAAVA